MVEDIRALLGNYDLVFKCLQPSMNLIVLVCLICVPLQYCQWFWRGFVCLSEQTDCAVHQETEGHQQIPHEKVSLGVFVCFDRLKMF